MSVDWSAIAIIGCKIDDPYVVAKRRGCYHQESEAKFCPECGKQMWIEETVISPILSGIEEEGKFIRYIRTCAGNRHYVGLNIADVDSHKNEVRVDLDVFKKDRLASLFEMMLKGLYKPENFGMWLILDAG